MHVGPQCHQYADFRQFADYKNIIFMLGLDQAIYLLCQYRGKMDLEENELAETQTR